MQDQATRIAVGLVLLVALWIGVYWWWPAGTDSGVSVAPPEKAASGANSVKPAPPTPPKIEPKVEPRPPAVEAPPAKPIAVVPPEFQEYTLRSGDTYSTISLRFYGTSAYASAIGKANPLLSPSNLRAGRVIRVPKDPKNIQGVPVKAGSGPQTAFSEYVVESGDTLSRIAATVYGESKLASLIFEANRDQLKDEDSLKVGQRLKIPPKPTQ